MVQHLYLSADLINVTDLKPQDSINNPYEYNFRIQCTKCRENHDKPITINLYEKYDIEGSRGEANFVSSCSFCKARSNINIQLPKDFKGYLNEFSGEKIKMLEIDARGFDIVEFIPQGPFICKGVDSNSLFKEIDLIENEWYDYDDITALETSITDAKWHIN